VATNPGTFLSNLRYYRHFLKRFRKGKPYLREDALNNGLIDWPEVSREELNLLGIPYIGDYYRQHLQVLSKKREAVQGVRDSGLRNEKKLVLKILEKDIESAQDQLKPTPTPDHKTSPPKPKVQSWMEKFMGWFDRDP
jgi:hypothetical protein